MQSRGEYADAYREWSKNSAWSKSAAPPAQAAARAQQAGGALYQPLSDFDAKALGKAGRIARGSAIAKGEAYEFNGWGPKIAARVAVKAKPKAAKAPSKAPIAPDDYKRLTLTERIARSRAVTEGRPWTPQGYPADFAQRVTVR